MSLLTERIEKLEREIKRLKQATLDPEAAAYAKVNEITTTDGKVIQIGERAYNYYDGVWMTLTRGGYPEANGVVWGTWKADPDETKPYGTCLDGSRMSSYEPSRP